MSTRGSNRRSGSEGPIETASGLSTEADNAAASGGRPNEDPKVDVERNQDDMLARQTNTRHKKVTADKWNQ